MTGHYQVLDVDDIKLDSKYQRVLHQEKVAKMVRNFMPEAFGVLIVSYRAGDGYYVLDGQHRIAAAKLKGIIEVPCRVLHGLSVEDEAFIFNLVNAERTLISPLERFKARIVFGDQRALEIQKILADYGYKIDLEHKKNTTNYPEYIWAVSTVERQYTRYGPGMLKKIMFVISNAWGGQTKATSGTMIEGVSLFLRENKNADLGRLVAKLKQVPTEVVLRDAKMYTMGRMAQGVAIALREIYNKNLRRGRL